jgi:hypothetical protein
MNKESFLDALKQQFTDEIHEAYIECEHGTEGKVDLPSLNLRIQKLMAHAQIEGLSPIEFQQLVRATLPGVADKIVFQAAKKAA